MKFSDRGDYTLSRLRAGWRQRVMKCLLLSFIEPILGNRYIPEVSSRAKGQLRTVDVPPHPVLPQTIWNLGWPDPHRDPPPVKTGDHGIMPSKGGSARLHGVHH